MSEFKKVAVFGAGGNVGPHIVKALLAADFTVSVLTRPSSTSSFPSTVAVVKTEYTQSALRDVLAGHDAVVSAVGFEGLASQIDIIDAAEAAGVKRFIPSEFGGTIEQFEVPELLSMFGAKIAVMDHLKKKAEANEGFSWTSLATGPFFDWGLEAVPFLGFDLQKRTATIYDEGTAPVTASTLPTIGKAVAGILQKPAETRNKMLKIRELQVTQNNILAALEKATEKEWGVTRLTTDEVLKDARGKLASGDFGGGLLGLLIAEMFVSGTTKSILVSEEESDNVLLGVQTEKLEDVVERIVKKA